MLDWRPISFLGNQIRSCPAFLPRSSCGMCSSRQLKPCWSEWGFDRNVGSGYQIKPAQPVYCQELLFTDTLVLMGCFTPFYFLLWINVAQAADEENILHFCIIILSGALLVNGRSHYFPPQIILSAITAIPLSYSDILTLHPAYMSVFQSCLSCMSVGESCCLSPECLCIAFTQLNTSVSLWHPV